MAPGAAYKSSAKNSSQAASNAKPLLDFVYQGIVMPELTGSSSQAGTAGADYARVLAAWNDTAAGRMPVALASGRLSQRGKSLAQFNFEYFEFTLKQLADAVGSGASSAVGALSSLAMPAGTSGPVVHWNALVTSAAVCPTTVQYSMPPNQQDSSVTVEITNLAVDEVVVVVTPSVDVTAPGFPRNLILVSNMTLTTAGGDSKEYSAEFNFNTGQQYAPLRCPNWVCAQSASASSPLDAVPYALNLNATAATERLPRGLTAATVPAGSTLGVYLNVQYKAPEDGSVPLLQEAQRQSFTLNFFRAFSDQSKPRVNELELPQYELLEQREVSVTLTRQLGRASTGRSRFLPLRERAPGNDFVVIKAQGQGLRPVALLALKDAFGHPRPCAGDVPVIDSNQILVDAAAGNAEANATQIVTSVTPVGPGLYMVSMRAALPGLVSLSARLSSTATSTLQPLTIKVLPADCVTADGVVPDTNQNNMTCVCDLGHGGSVSDGISATVAQTELQRQQATSEQMGSIFSQSVRNVMSELALDGMSQSISEISLTTGGVADTGGLDVCGIYAQGSVGNYNSLPPHVSTDAFQYTALESLTSLVASKESAGRVDCSPCSAGKRSNVVAVQECLDCSAGQFSAPGAADCKACPDFGATCTNGVLRVKDDHWWEKGDTISAADAATQKNHRFHACPFLGLCNVEDVSPSDTNEIAAGNQGSAGARRLVSLASNFDLDAGGGMTSYGFVEFRRWWSEATAAEHHRVQTARKLQTIGNFNLVNDTSASLALASQTEQRVNCRDGHRGPMCQSCEPGFVNGGTGACMRCTSVAVSWVLFAVTILVVGFFCVFWIRRRVRRSRFRTTQSGAQRIGLSFIQMCTVLTSLRLRVPQLFGVIEQGGSVGDGVSMDLYPIQCTFKPTYHERLLGYMLLPMLAIILPAILLFATLPLRRSMWAKRDAKRRELLRSLGVNGEMGERASASAAKDDSEMVNPMRSGGKPTAADADSSKRSPTSPKGLVTKKGGAKKSKIPRREMPPTVEGSKNLAYASAVVLVFLVYNRVFRELVSAFHEYQFPIEGHQRLVADLLVKANSEVHLGWRVIAGVLLAVYAVGLPIGTLILLYRNREHLWPTAEGLALEEKLQRGQADAADAADATDSTDKNGKKLKNQSQAFNQAVKIQGKMEASDKTKLSALLAQHQVFHRFSFLYDGYRHDLYWWEVLVVLRKILVVLVSATITDGHTQMFAAAGIVTISLALQLSVQPYLIPALNALETLSLCSTLILMLGSLLFWQVGAEQGPALALTAVLFIVLIATLSIFLYAFLGGAAKARLRKTVGEKNFKMCTRCIKRSCKNKRSPAEIRAEMLADEAQYDAGVAKSSAVLAKGAAPSHAESKAAVSGIGTDRGGMMANPLTARNPLMNAAAGSDNKTRKGFTPRGRV